MKRFSQWIVCSRFVTAMSNAIAGSVPARRVVSRNPPAASSDSSGHASEARSIENIAVAASIGMCEIAAT